MTATPQSPTQHYVAAPLTPKTDEEPRNAPFCTKPNPLSSATLASVTLAHWIQPLLSLGNKRVLERADIWPIAIEDSCDVLEARFLKEYDPHAPSAPFGLSPIAWAFAKTFRVELTVIFVNGFVYIVALAVQAYVAQAILQFMNGIENLFGIESGYVLLVLMTISAFVSVTCLNYCFFLTSRVGINMRTLTMDLVYQKALKLSNAARQEYTAGEVLTLMSVDAERVFNAMMQGPWLIISFFAFAITVIVLAVLFNIYSALCAAAVLVLLLVISAQQGDRIARVQRQLLTIMDERVKVTSEALQGIRVMKFYAWEGSLARRVEKIRAVEVELMRKFHFLQVSNTVMLFLMPAFLAGVSLGVYVLIRHTITVIEAFTMIAMVNISRSSATVLPQAIAALSQGKIAYNRIDVFLASDEFAFADELRPTQMKALPATINANHSERGSISIRQASFEWSLPSNAAEVVVVGPDDVVSHEIGRQDSPSNDKMVSVDLDATSSSTAAFAMNNVSLEIDAGSLVMIVGTVGSGKSSLLSAMLGEMNRTSGDMNIDGNVAYVSQEAWIRNLSLRENVLFDAEFIPDRYERVLEATQLAIDLHALPDGDQTEIGERGINLSGGQKARVAIARAMYCLDYDILILDDPLSAVDPHVAHAIFDQCIAGLACDKTRLLVLNSHYDLLEHADKIVVVEHGQIVGDGSYEEIMARFPDLRTQSSKLNAAEEDVIDEHDKVAEEKAIQEVRKSIAEEPAVAEVHLAGEDNAKKEGNGENDPVKLVQEEDRVRGTVSGSTYKAYFDETGVNGIVVMLSMVLIYAISQAVRVIVDWWPSHWAKNMARRYDIDPTYSGTVFGMWYLGFIALCFIVTLGRALLMVDLCVRSSTNMHTELFRRVLRAPINMYFDVTPIGRILNRFSNDLDQIDSVLPQQYQIFFQNTLVCLGSLVVASFASYWIAISYIPVIVMFVIIGMYFKKTSAEVKRLEGISRTPVYNLFNETLSGLHTIRAFKMQDRFKRRNKEVVDENTAMYMTYWCVSRWLAVRLDLLSVIIIFVVTLYLIATKGQISAMVSGLALTYSLMLASQVQWVMRAVDRTDNAMTSVERLMHFRTIPTEATSTLDEDDDQEEASAAAFASQWPALGSIRFDNLCLRYRPELPLVLRGVNMDIQAGEKVGICGRTGAGKSSLMIALFRICEYDNGTVLIDGVDLQSVKLRDLRRSLAIIPQDPVLFSGSLRENLDPYNDYSDAAIWRVLKQVHLADAVEKWGSGLEFVVSECGDNLSVGQRQLLCIGRALLKDSKIVVLDEATANVDSATDELIQVTIKQTFVDKTVLIIAHRINTIMHCDKIAVMDAGRIAEFASPSDLLERSDSIFASLAKRSMLQ